MPPVYLSLSPQEGSDPVSGGSEEYHMNHIAHTIVPYLRAGGLPGAGLPR